MIILICNNCGNEISDGSLFCSQCGAPAAASVPKSTAEHSENTVNDNTANTVLEAVDTNIHDNTTGKKGKKIIITISVFCSILLTVFIIWIFSGGILIDLANSSLAQGDPDTAISYLDIVCSFGYKNKEAREFKTEIETGIETLNEATECIAVNDYISALNKAKESVDIIPAYSIAESFYADYTERFSNWLKTLYDKGEFSEAAHAFAQLSDSVNNDVNNTALSDLKALFKNKSDEFLVSAQNYYNNFEPAKAEENVKIVISLDPQNIQAQELQTKINTYNENKKKIDQAQQSYNSGDYTSAIASFDSADDYTKTVHKQLRADIQEAKRIQDIDAQYSSYTGNYSAGGGIETLSITKIEGGKIWFSGESMAMNRSFTFSGNGIPISSNGVFTAPSHGYGIDYEASELTGEHVDKKISGTETFTMSGGVITHRTTHFSLTYTFTKN